MNEKRKVMLTTFTYQQYESIAMVLLANELTFTISDAFSKNGKRPLIPIMRTKLRKYTKIEIISTKKLQLKKIQIELNYSMLCYPSIIDINK